MKLLSEKLYSADQSWIYETLWDLPAKDHRIKVVIRRNAYDSQSYGRAYLFSASESKWNEVAHTSGLKLKCKDASYAMDEQRIIREYKKQFSQDTNDLLQEVKLILG